MPLPGLQMVTVTGRYTHPDGTAMQGTVSLEPTCGTVVSASTGATVQGTATAAFDTNGDFTLTVVATDATGINPQGFTYNVRLSFYNAPPAAFTISLPKAAPAVTLPAITPVPAAVGTYTVVTGPAGPTGPTGAAGATGPAGPQPPLGAAGAGPTIALKSDDASTTNARTPLAHKASHATGGSDAIKPSDIGALASTTVRRRDFPVLAPGIYTGSFTPTLTATSTQPAATIGWRPPLVTMAGTGDTAEQRGPFGYIGTLASDLALSDTVTPGFNYVVSTALQPHIYTNNQTAWGVRFRTSAQVVHIRFRYMATTNAIQILVGGQRLWAIPQLISGMAGVGTAGNSHILAIDFGSVAARDIQVELGGPPFWGIYTATAYPLSGATPQGLHLCGFGDSITGGSNVNAGAGIGTWLFRLGHRLGCSRITNASRGGTGFTATNAPYTALTDPARYNDDVIAKNPDIVLVWAGYNDDGSAGSQAAWQAAVDTVLTGLKAGLPNALIILVGTHSPTGTWGAYSTPSTLVSKDTWGRARATANAVPFISPVTGDVLNASGALLGNLGIWITGQGHVTVPTGYGNADWAIGSSTDAVHPTDLGHEHVAQLMYDSLMLILAT